MNKLKNIIFPKSKSLENYRLKLDEIDSSLQSLLEKRMEVSREIGRFKLEENLPTFNRERELEILANIRGPYSSKLRNIYECIFDQSKSIQNFDYFLVGKSLTASFSPKIYEFFGLANYKTYETDDFGNLDKLNFKGINVTNPYKKDALNKCSEITPVASITKSVNLILKKGNTYFGDNTDYYGFRSLLKKFKIEVTGRDVIIIGNGSSSRMARLALKDEGARSIIVLCRTPRVEDEYPLTTYKDYLHVNLIVNTTPYGTYPNLEDKPLFELSKFTKLSSVVDLVYNPLKTPLMIEAEKYNIKAISGLYMLVGQAAKNASYYLGSDLSGKINEVYMKILKYQLNVVLIGMPFVGKSYLGDRLVKIFDKTYVDVDTELEKKNFDLKTILKTSTLEDYREKEAYETNVYSKKWNQIISTGGGIVLNDEVMKNLKRTGIIIFLNEELDSLYPRIDGSRALVKTKEDLKKLYDERISLYNKYADILIDDSFNTGEITEKINEYINSKWS